MKEWKSAEIVELDMSETEYASLEGTVVDGPYNVDCTEEEYYAYS